MLSQFMQEPNYYKIMLPDLKQRQDVDDSYKEMYRRVKVDEQYDIELILKYLTSISDKIDWFDVDIFDKVLEMRDAAMKASYKI